MTIDDIIRMAKEADLWGEIYAMQRFAELVAAAERERIAKQFDSGAVNVRAKGKAGMILAKEFEGELWVKASDLERKIKQAVEAEREACADVAENWRCNGMPRTILAEQIRARRQE